MNSITDWLNLESQWPGDDQPEVLGEGLLTNLRVFCALFHMDAGGYGIITGGVCCKETPYGRKGLHQEESYHLSYTLAFLQGWTACDPTQKTLVDAALAQECLRVRGLFA